MGMPVATLSSAYGLDPLTLYVRGTLPRRGEGARMLALAA